MYLKISGNLVDILGEKARGDIEGECGLLISPLYQCIQDGVLVSIAKIVDEQKANEYIQHPDVEILSTVEEVNNVINNYFSEEYTLSDSTALLLSLQLSGKTVSDIPGYDVNKPMEHQDNLEALYNAGLSGIRKKSKPPYIEDIE